MYAFHDQFSIINCQLNEVSIRKFFSTVCVINRVNGKLKAVLAAKNECVSYINVF